MTEMRKRMIESLQLAGFSEGTQEPTSEPAANWLSIITSHLTLSPRKNSDSISSTLRMPRSTPGQPLPSPYAESSSSSKRLSARDGRSLT